jgi:hypothetical protein
LEFRRIILLTLKSREFVLSSFFLFLFLIIGLFTAGIFSYKNDSIIQYAYSDFRSCVFFLFFFLLIISPQWKNNIHRESFIIYILWPFVIFDFLSVKIIADNAVETIRILTSVPSTIVILMTIYLRKGKFLIALLLLALCSYHAIFSFSRNYIFILIVGYLTFVYFLITTNKGNKIKKLALVTLTVVLPVIISPIVYDFWASDTRSSIHTIERTEQMIYSKGGTESERSNSLILPFIDTEFYLLPHGLGWRNQIEKIQKHYVKGEVLSSMDSMFYYLIYHFGFFIGLILSIKILLYVFNSVFTYSKNQLKSNIFCFSVLFLASFFTQASSFTMLQFAFGNSLLLALLHKNVYLTKSYLKR